MDEGKTIPKHITYSTKKDKEIHDWFESLPTNHSVFIRKAILFYLEHKDKDIHLGEGNERLEQLEQRMQRLEEMVFQQEGSKPIETNNKDPFISATEILKDLGK